MVLKSVLTSGRVVLKAQIDVLGDTETEAAGGGEVLLLQLVLLHLEGAIKDLVGLEAADLHTNRKQELVLKYQSVSKQSDLQSRGRQSSRFCGCRRISRCSELWNSYMSAHIRCCDKASTSQRK